MSGRSADVMDTQQPDRPGTDGVPTMSPPARRRRAAAINAAFLKEIKEDHLELKRALERGEELTFHPQVAINHWPELLAAVDQLVDCLGLHFSLEENYGYLDGLGDIPSDAQRNANRLRAQHALLFARLVRLDDELDDLSPGRTEAVEAWCGRFRRFTAALRRHEDAENRLILYTMNSVLGVGD